MFPDSESRSEVVPSVSSERDQPPSSDVPELAARVTTATVDAAAYLY